MIATLVFAALFYCIAEYEHMTGWKWAAASLAISVVVLQVTGWLVLVLPFQAALFGVLWWQNSKKLDTAEDDRAVRLEEDRRIRQERVRRAHEQADRDSNRRR